MVNMCRLNICVSLLSGRCTEQRSPVYLHLSGFAGSPELWMGCESFDVLALQASPKNLSHQQRLINVEIYQWMRTCMCACLHAYEHVYMRVCVVNWMY